MQLQELTDEVTTSGDSVETIADFKDSDIKASFEKMFPNLTEAQKKILSRLPPNLYDFCKNIEEEQFSYERRYDLDTSETKDSELHELRRTKLVAGKFFELIVKAEFEEEGKEETPLGSELRDVIHDPKEYFGDELGTLYPARNPDLALVDETTGTITGWVECKLGVLDTHSIKQLSAKGFENSFRNSLVWLKSSHVKKVMIDKGILPNILNHLDNLSIAPKPKKWLVISRKDEKDEKDSAIVPGTIEAIGGLDEFKRILRQYTIKQSLFSKEEIYKLVEILLGVSSNEKTK